MEYQTMVRLKRDIILGGDLRTFHAAHHGTFACTLAARGQEAYCTSRHFERGARGPILFIPDAGSACVFIGGEAALDQNFGTFLKILVADFSLFAPGGDAEPDCFLTLLAAAGGVLAIGGNRKGCHCLTGGRITHFRVLANIADDDNCVEHGNLLGTRYPPNYDGEIR